MKMRVPLFVLPYSVMPNHANITAVANNELVKYFVLSCTPVDIKYSNKIIFDSDL